MQSAQNNFRTRTFKTYVVNANWATRGLFKVGNSLLDDFAREKLVMCSSLEDLHGKISKCCLEEKYGGYCPNKEDSFFPPDMLIENEKMVPSESEKINLSKDEEKWTYQAPKNVNYLPT